MVEQLAHVLYGHLTSHVKKTCKRKMGLRWMGQVKPRAMFHEKDHCTPLFIPTTLSLFPFTSLHPQQIHNGNLILRAKFEIES